MDGRSGRGRSGLARHADAARAVFHLDLGQLRRVQDAGELAHQLDIDLHRPLFGIFRHGGLLSDAGGGFKREEVGQRAEPRDRSPRGLPDAVTMRLRDAMRETMQDAAVLRVFETAGSPPAYQYAAEFSRFTEADSASLIAAVQRIGRVD